MEEALVVAVVDFWNHYWAAKRDAKLVLPVDRPRRRNESPGIKLIVSEIFKKRSVDIVRAGSCRVNFEARSGAAVFSAEVAAHKFEFADGFDRRRREHQAAAFWADAADSVHQDFLGAILRSVDLGVGRIASDAGRQ